MKRNPSFPAALTAGRGSLVFPLVPGDARDPFVGATSDHRPPLDLAVVGQRLRKPLVPSMGMNTLAVTIPRAASRPAEAGRVMASMTNWVRIVESVAPMACG